MLKVDSDMLKTIADLHEVPQGAYNIRKNGAAMGRRSTEHIQVIPKQDKTGIDIKGATSTKNETVR
ncbi:MAG: ABC transporter permease, partial [Eubacterium sp.]|nr:ABC transporter permease [Eubacterium sp.]